MIKEYVDIWNEHKDEIRKQYEETEPSWYPEIVKSVIELIYRHNDDYHRPDPNRIVEIDHGDYQGTLLYVIGAKGYQPSKYYYVKINYGSCSGCDTLMHIQSIRDEKKRVNDLMTLALHIIQNLKVL